MVCDRNMTEVALAILKYPDMCAINHVIRHCITAFWLAQQNNMTDVIKLICPHIDFIATLRLTPIQADCFEHYINMRLTEKINQLPNNEEIKKRQEVVNNLEDRINNMSRDDTCVICFGDTYNNTVFIKCKHILHICNECSHITAKKCPICTTSTEIITGCYAV